MNGEGLAYCSAWGCEAVIVRVAAVGCYPVIRPHRWVDERGGLVVSVPVYDRCAGEDRGAGAGGVLNECGEGNGSSRV